MFVLVLGYASGDPSQWIIPISAFICLLIAVVVWSYRQTIHAYPSGGGSYIVANDNLGPTPGLLAAGALMIDYVLTVAVSVAAGVGNVTSAFPDLTPYASLISIGLILLLMLGNLRGLRESGAIFAVPTYFFIFIFLIMIALGLIQLLSPNHAIVTFEGCAGAIPNPQSCASDIIRPTGFNTQAIDLILIFQAFAAGCSALTGVEAISNGVPAFRKPESKNAATTLIWMGALLIIFFIGISILASGFHAQPTKDDSETIISQLGRVIFGNNSVPYFLVQAATALILILAANTSFSDFPRLASILSRDKYLPHIFAFRGDRLAFTTGIAALGGLAISLILVFGADVQKLIPLYAVGVFLAFTLSQSGMVVHWQRIKRKGGNEAKGATRSQLINGLGAFFTGVVLIIIASTKFLEGAWLVVLLIPMLYLMFKSIHKHYVKVASQLVLTPTETLTTNDQSANNLGLRSNQPYQVIVPISDVNKVSLSALNFAKALNEDVTVTAVFISDEHEAIDRLKQKWATSKLEIPLVILDVPIRSVIRPLTAYLDHIHEQRKNEVLVVVLPEFVAKHGWEQILHNQTALRLKVALYRRPGVVVMNVPYQLN
jgi:amino acid transporter